MRSAFLRDVDLPGSTALERVMHVIQGVGMAEYPLAISGETLTRRQRWTMFSASTSGALETFDMVIYGFFAREIGRAFFPASGGTAETRSFAVLAPGYLARPLGGFLTGHLGNRHGRRQVFASSATIAAVSTLFIGVLPDYSLGVRFSGVAATINLGLATSMGAVPLLASILVARTRWVMAPSLLIVLGGVIALIASLAMEQFSEDDISVCEEPRKIDAAGP